ncbi:MAG TPA: carbon monoxide dehydrogenase subunit G [Caulobacteraceae bacterium]|nr:carbon monoxide dehydrogenase subunit G [Caulobacteraceae bacterium]
MEQAGQHRISAPRARVWAALNDPEVLKRCIEGCEELTSTAGDAFHAVVRAKVGPLSAAFTGDVTLKDVDPPNGYTLEVSASGGATGFARGTAKVALADAGGDTLLTYTAEGRVGGKLAQIGQRLIDAAARKTADDFFDAFARELAPPLAESAVGAATVATKTQPNARLLWVAAAAALVMAGLLVWQVAAR